MDARRTQLLAAYLPRRLLARLSGVDRAPAAPWNERFRAAVMIADVSGFTRLAEELAQRGEVGPEQLSEALNTYFGRLIDILEAHGGDVVRFAGDAPIVLFAVGDAPDDLRRAALRAARCALALQEALDGYEVAPSLRLSMRVYVTAGEVVAATVGGVEGRWEYLVGGAPLDDIGAFGAAADPGQVLLSGSAFGLLSAAASGVPTDSGAVRLERIQGAPALEPTATAPIDRLAVAALAPFVPRTVLYHVDAGDTRWFAERRLVTVAFVNLFGIHVERPGALERLQSAFVAVQSAVYRYEGSINQFLVDDKGLTVLALWGVASRTHEDDPSRAMRSLLEMTRALGKMGVSSAAGVTTSRVYCGHRGSVKRREFAVIGPSVNLAARFMTSAARLPVPRPSAGSVRIHTAQAS